MATKKKEQNIEELALATENKEAAVTPDVVETPAEDVNSSVTETDTPALSEAVETENISDERAVEQAVESPASMDGDVTSAPKKSAGRKKKTEEAVPAADEVNAATETEAPHCRQTVDSGCIHRRTTQCGNGSG